MKNLTFIEETMNSNYTKVAVKNDIHSNHRDSLQNLIHYLSLRSIDIRKMQNELHTVGLSSLTSSESHILRQVQEVKMRLGKKYSPTKLSKLTETKAGEIFQSRIHKLFGQNNGSNFPFIMVTCDKSFAEDYAFIKSLLLKGMNVARINCAHDNPEIWSGLIHLIKKACIKTGKTCKIYMDLAGPKIRTQILSKRKHTKKPLAMGQLIWLTEQMNATFGKDLVINPGIPDLIGQLRKGERVWIDDGLIQGVIEHVDTEKAAVRITRIAGEKKKIKEDKGINLPDSNLNIASLTTFDIECLPFISQNADMVGYSFVKTPGDLALLRKEFAEQNLKQPNIIVKIETIQAVNNLPSILLEGMKDPSFGVMIARGDLAVEIGFERTGEIQEEILWLCEAAHVPVIWATQVLESLNKSGVATRSEITDAAHAAAADCVMLNKGPHTIEVLETLNEIIKRTTEHKNKKRYLFRTLKIAKDYIQKLQDESPVLQEEKSRT